MSPEPGDTDWSAQLRRVAEGDRAAFALLYAHFAPRLKSFMLRSGAGETLAEDIAQDVMASVWHKAPQFDAARAGASTWIFTIARNRRIDDQRRAARPEPEVLDWGPEPEPDPTEALSVQAETDLLHRALHGLPQAQRELIERAYFGEQSHREIAVLTGLPLGTIKSRIRLALDRLRHGMDRS
ncbi:sigma-70 family RNA polymerase sigma factor [Profundibacterium mesophilum]|nr:sigma-70 family RNA polymerase sigma factor [Profundibacterium mesophilum]